ncbi:Oidioi.mRNA.OKI2018_I69.PAR.g12648.t1.cds [Oikopleura dioica]|uniref:Oidioi.mRNA.OKI2018_I69.PAR.g12648.t1.cds n=1 Tax=Oikopleura dioica TaxID=34765 RepID=A0ABN7S7V9_OIKDI|nr:Oidioi.mRNA.OKI2018_I69.PAR.g12648.t1.cds [Oikopleura dioica]
MEELKIWSKKNRLKSEITFNQDVNHITGRGLYSPKSVRKGEPLLQVPTGLIIDLPFILDECCSTYEFFDTYTVSRFPQKVSIPHQDIFIHFLIAEAAQKNASRVAGWIGSFPRESNHLPFNWPIDIRKCVCDESLQKAMKEEAAQFDALVSRFEHYCSVIDDVKFSRDTLAWAYSVWSSRLYELPEFPESSSQSASLPKWLERSDPTDLRSFGFLPIFDLINHSSTPNVFLNIRRKHVWDKTKKIHFSEKYLLSLEAKKNITKGEELKLSYGDFSDRQLFLKYGFVLSAGENKSARLDISPRLVQDTGIKASGAYCSYDDLHVSIRERKEIVQDLHLDSFFLQKTGDELTTDLHQAALAFLLPGTTKESTILQIKERMGVNQKTKIALKHFYVHLTESIKEKLKNEIAELDFRLCRERYPIKYHLVKSLKKSEIALANELFETYNNQLQILKNGEKAARPQVLSTITNLGSQKKPKEVGNSGNQNILSRLREKLAKKSKPAEESKIVTVAERSAGVRKLHQFREQVRQEDLSEKTEEEKAISRICRSIQAILSERIHQKAPFFLLLPFTPLIDQEVEDNRFHQGQLLRSPGRIRLVLLVLAEKDLHTSEGLIPLSGKLEFKQLSTLILHHLHHRQQGLLIHLMAATIDPTEFLLYPQIPMEAFLLQPL